MEFVADLHIHSKFSRATSREMILDTLAYWAKVKGIRLLAAADFTHPEWLFLTREKLEPEGNGFYRLKNVIPPKNEYLKSIPFSPEDISFILSTEISFIYSKRGKVRKVHLLILAPDFDSVDRLNRKLSGLGNLRSDGRPILGLDAKTFVKIVADLCPQCVVIPSHIWTPWFSLFGANSGFDSIEECFEEMTPFIFALETGLSSDPPMNWRLSCLDKYTLVSNSDAHSPSRIGREANVFNTDFSFRGLVEVLKSQDPEKFLYTVEFFPEEGKYHYDGHRKCGVVFSPQETLQHNYICPECRRKLTVGVMHRVEDLADREYGEIPPHKISFKNLIPLNEIIAKAVGKTSECKSVWDSNDIESRTIIFNNYKKMCYYYIKKFNISGKNKEDFTQALLLRLWELIPDIEDTITCKPFLSKCLKNSLKKLIKQEKKYSKPVIICDEVIIDDVSPREYMCDIYTIMKKDLTQRERDVIDLRYGLRNNPQLTLKELSELGKVSIGTVQQIEVKAIKKIRDKLNGD